MMRHMMIRTTPRLVATYLKVNRPLVIRVGTRALATLTSSGATSEVQEKLKRIIEEYRQANYTQTAPASFIKSVLDGIDTNHDGLMSMAEVDNFLKNIGAEEKMSSEEIEEIMMEWGCDCDDVYEMDAGVPVDIIQGLYLNKEL